MIDLCSKPSDTKKTIILNNEHYYLIFKCYLDNSLVFCDKCVIDCINSLTPIHLDIKSDNGIIF